MAGLVFDQLTEAQVVKHIINASLAGAGGWAATPNVDICRIAAREHLLRELIYSATLVVPDGMPVLWAARLAGGCVPERVTGSSLIFTLTEAAAQSGRSIYLLGGGPGVPARAAEALRRRYPGLLVAGHDCPSVGFDTDAHAVEQVRRSLVAAAPDIVYVGMGCPKQEHLIALLGPSLPAAWFLSCGAAIPLAAGTLRRAPAWMQKTGLEWVFRLLTEPRRLAGRYARDLPFAIFLLASSASQRVRLRK